MERPRRIVLAGGPIASRKASTTTERNDGFLTTLPLRVVLQGYPTVVTKELPAGSTVVEIGCARGIDWYGLRYRMIELYLSRKRAARIRWVDGYAG
jgi:hypothetical protein